MKHSMLKKRSVGETSFDKLRGYWLSPGAATAYKKLRQQSSRDVLETPNRHLPNDIYVLLKKELPTHDYVDRDQVE